MEVAGFFQNSEKIKGGEGEENSYYLWNLRIFVFQCGWKYNNHYMGGTL